MAQVKFYLEKRKDADGTLITKDVPIFLFFSFNGKRLQHYTGIRINKSSWNPESMLVEKHPESKRYNETLKRLKRWVEEINDNSKALSQFLTLEEFRNKLKEKTGDAPVKGASKSFREHFEEYLEVSKLSKKPKTITTIRTTYNNLLDFSSKTRTALEFDNINQDFYNKLLDYCFKVKKFKNNNTGKIIKNLKAFLNWATENGYNKNLEFKKKAFKKLQELPEIVYLTFEELTFLYKMKIEDENHKRARDLFCFGCFTGMRYTDIVTMSRDDVHKDKIVYRIDKTNEMNSIPINSYTRSLLNKYKKEKTPLPHISNTDVNDYLKKLGELAEFNRKIKITHFRGGERIVTVTPLKELITFHVSKKTFMTNFLARGGSLETAMAITGNKDYQTAKRYFKVVDTLKSDEMQRVFGK